MHSRVALDHVVARLKALRGYFLNGELSFRGSASGADRRVGGEGVVDLGEGNKVNLELAQIHV